MTKQKSTKRALLLSALSLLMCVSMLIGSTFAWFTDSVTSKGNIIKSGTLDVTMEWADGTKAVPADDSADWIDASTGAIFNYKLWEPGYTEVRHIKIANEGTLALKYQLNILANGEVSELADVIDVYYLDPADVVDDRADLTADMYIGTLTEVLANISTTASGNLEAGEKDTITLALKMQESAGNYYQDMAIGSDFSIQLLATQLTSEFDSFDNQYDKNAWTEVAEAPVVDAEGAVAVWTAEQLAGVMANINGIKTVNIMENIDLSGRNWAPADFWVGGTITINGNGHTISNMTVSGSGKLGFIGSNRTNITINDLTFANAEVEATGSFAGVVIGYAYGNITLNNVDVVDSNVATDIAKKGIRVGGLIGFVPQDGGTLTLKDCDVTGSDISGYHNVGAMVGATMTKQTVTVENCTAKNNTLTYGSAKVGAFAFGAYTSGNTEYVPASGFTAENNVVNCVTYVSNATELQAAIDADKKNIVLSAGNYTVSADNGAELVGAGTDTVIDIDGVIGNINISNATVTGATSIDVENGETVKFKDVVFDAKIGGASGGQYGSVYGDITFDGCTFEKFLHFDSTHGANILIENCTFGVLGSLKVGAGATSVEVKNCTFEDTTSTSIWGEKGMTIYCPATFTKCEFSNRAVLAGSTGLELTFNSCTMNGGTPVYYVDNTDGIIRGGNVPTVVINN